MNGGRNRKDMRVTKHMSKQLSFSTRAGKEGVRMRTATSALKRLNEAGLSSCLCEDTASAKGKQPLGRQALCQAAERDH